MCIRDRLVTGGFVDECLDLFLSAAPELDYLDTMSSGTFPYGLSVEVIRRAALHQAWREATEPADREHVTSFVRRFPLRFSSLSVRNDRDDSDLRWTVDTHEDLRNMAALYASLGSGIHTMDWRAVAGHCRLAPPTMGVTGVDTSTK